MLNAYCLPGTALSTGDIVLNKQNQTTSLSPWGGGVGGRETKPSIPKIVCGHGKRWGRQSQEP